MFSREDTHAAATAGPSSEAPGEDAVVDVTALKSSLVRAPSARSPPRDYTPVPDTRRASRTARRANRIPRTADE